MHLKRTISLLLLGSMMLARSAMAQQAIYAADSKEIDTEKLSKVKAAFLFNFFKFTTWPESRFDNPTMPFKVVIVGEDDIGNVLDTTLRGRDWHGHPIQVSRINANTRIELAATHVVYIAPSSGVSSDDIQSFVRSGILVVGYDRNIVRSGAILGFSIEDGKVSFAYNASSVKQSALQISSKLLSLGKAVD